MSNLKFYFEASFIIDGRHVGLHAKSNIYDLLFPFMTESKCTHTYVLTNIANIWQLRSIWGNLLL